MFMLTRRRSYKQLCDIRHECNHHIKAKQTEVKSLIDTGTFLQPELSS